jgi:biopolymer transport protein ExbD
LYNAVPRIALLLVLILIIVQHHFPTRATGLRVKIATDTCGCDERLYRTILLHMFPSGEWLINSEPVKLNELATKCSAIYSTRNERVLYLSGDENVPFQRIVEAIDIVQQSKFPALHIPVAEPPELRGGKRDNLDIEIRLITPGAISTPCRDDCYNWGKQGLLQFP